MKIKFYVHEYYWPPKNNKPESRYLARYAKLQEAPPELEMIYTSYIFDAIASDFRYQLLTSCAEIFNEIKDIEEDREKEFVFYGDAFIHRIKNILCHSNILFLGIAMNGQYNLFHYPTTR